MLPIFKKRGRGNFENYQGIALLEILASAIKRFMEENLGEYHEGFSNRSDLHLEPNNVRRLRI